MTHIIFLNGPPRAGKDTASSILHGLLPGIVKRLGFADHLKIATHAAYGLYDTPFNYFESVKDQPLDVFFGLTPRQAYIAHSEKYMKVLHGNLVFGDLWLTGAKGITPTSNFLTVPDSGFAPEALPGIEHFGAKNCTLIRMHRPGHDYLAIVAATSSCRSRPSTWKTMKTWACSRGGQLVIDKRGLDPRH